MTAAHRLVLVTGGAGYIGSHVVRELLATGKSVRVVDSLMVGNGSSLESHLGHPELEFVHGDVRDPAVRAQALVGAPAVVHLAAVVGDPACRQNPTLATEVNHLASRALLHDAESAGCRRLVFASTCSNYGRLADGETFAKEDWPLRPVSLYAETKVATELEVLAAARPEFVTTCLRFATVYGVSERMRFDLTVNEFTRDALLKAELVVYGEQFWRPYVHVRDAARAVAAALDAPGDLIGGEVFNVGDTDQNFRKQDLVELLVARLPETKVAYVAQADDPRDYRVSFDKIGSMLGFQITTTVPEGIDEVLTLLRSGAVEDPYSEAFRN